ncbi:sigma-54-dependent Fis family transcriptional regulator [Candidatus Sumerlaeota bacterium]|nr:sigma-54-dependent Fis family transcriptional regulator [Candidatus Sumerlaeota bacterium]
MRRSRQTSPKAEMEDHSPSRKPRILIADDEPDLLELMQIALSPLNADITLARDGLEAIALLRRASFDLVLSDQNMPGASGIDILNFTRTLGSAAPLFILVTAFGTIDMVVEAMRAGAYHFIEKPFEMSDLTERVHKALETLELAEENRTLRQALESHYVFSEIVGTSRALRAAVDLARRASEQSSPVLLLGESGAGKDLLARAIHFHGNRHKKPFIAINCGAIPENLIESEFFGHKKGAFTGAIANRRGCFEEVAGGTLFLDEIGEMPYDLQVKLLRVLEERKIRRVGENIERPVDFRIIAATNRSLIEEVEKRRFRQDLFYRLNVLSIQLPSLKERPEDVIPLAEHFLKKAHSEMRSNVKAITPSTLELLQSYDFPGNVRELINILERAILLCDGDVIEPRHLPPEVRGQPDADIPAPAGFNLKEEVRKAQLYVERQLIQKALEATHGNHKRAAGLLGISRASLYTRIHRNNGG